MRILYVRGLQLHTTEGNIRRFFESFSTGIEKVKKTKDFCFVHFETRAQAESAYNYIKCKSISFQIFLVFSVFHAHIGKGVGEEH